jgi:hypothetical protein
VGATHGEVGVLSEEVFYEVSCFIRPDSKLDADEAERVVEAGVYSRLTRELTEEELLKSGHWIALVGDSVADEVDETAPQDRPVVVLAKEELVDSLPIA